MSDGFVPLHLALAPSQRAVQPKGPPSPDESVGSEADAGADVHDARDTAEARDAAGEIRRFRAALADALDVRLTDLLRDIACDVLARELALAPADVMAVANAALKRFAEETPLRLRANSADLAALAGVNVPSIADGSLRRGDVVVELQCGTIDARLGIRLATVLDR